MTQMKSQEPQAGFLTSVWRSIFRGPLYPTTERERKRILFSSLILHFRPMRVPKQTLSLSHTFGLGGMSALLVTLLAATGVLLMFVYSPFPGLAYDSIRHLQDEVLFGKLVRNIHYWSANFLIVLAFLHLLRVYFTGAYHPPRQFNWIIGLLLLIATLMSNFTGYLLPWDQLSYWAITICTGMIGYIPGIGNWLQGIIRGGSEIGSATLINFYTLHTTVLPVLIIALMGFHFWRVRKARGVVLPRSTDQEQEVKPEYVLTLPNLLLREFVVALVLVAVILMLAVIFNAPLGDVANPGMSPNPAKAPWYFLGFQELLLHFHPLFAVVILPLLASGALLAIPYLGYDSARSGVWFLSHQGRLMAAGAALTALVVTPIWILVDEFWIDFSAWLPGVPQSLSNGLLPTSMLLAALVAYCRYSKKRFSLSYNELIQMSFVLIAVAFVVLTVTGVWFRGAGMALEWPWN